MKTSLESRCSSAWTFAEQVIASIIDDSRCGMSNMAFRTAPPICGLSCSNFDVVSYSCSSINSKHVPANAIGMHWSFVRIWNCCVHQPARGKELRESLPEFAGRKTRQFVAHSWLLNHHQYIFCSICTVWPEFQCQIIAAQSDPRLGSLFGHGGGRKWLQSKCHPHIPIRLLYTVHTIGLSCTVWPRCTGQQTDRQTKRSEQAASAIA